ncbi:hypothetical protein M408DRAFT_332085 [Serendipita vermifera MAFF 305830]|uniref:3'-5' exonuclease domain-containing protein n=1 Tax=Serendipita vermifera MAFF 305830 TaxID=933852 RepID=A0A0C2X381_SERVB|nr:hypothetical protein M408DRAFT_332085 [Serendipita vermifera MAFF 305830]
MLEQSDPTQSQDRPLSFKDSSLNSSRMEAAVKTSTLIDAHKGTAQPAKPPLSPPTSPPLAVASTMNGQDVKLQDANDISITQVSTSRGRGHVATPSGRGWFQALAAALPSYTFTTVNPARKILYLRKRDEASMHSTRVRKSGVNVVGFDLEWKPMRDGSREYNKVSLVQVATPDEILLIQLPESSKFPTGLRALLEDQTILKVGAGIQNDVDKLKWDWRVDVKNYLDLGFVARYHDYFWDTCDVLQNQCLEGAFGGTWCNEAEPNVASTKDSESKTHVPLESQYGRPVYPASKPVALARLVSRYLGKRLDKTYQLSNWAAVLDENQIQYAANDGFSGLDVYNALIRLRDRTPGWVDAQATFYRMLIESQRIFAMAPHQPAMYSFNQPQPRPVPAPAVDEEDTFFAMDGDEPRSLLQLSNHRHASSDTPALYRSSSEPHLAKMIGSVRKASSDFKQEKTDFGQRTHYPSPPVTPTHSSLSPASIPSPTSTSKSAPASPLSATRMSVKVRFSDSVNSANAPSANSQPSSLTKGTIYHTNASLTPTSHNPPPPGLPSPILAQNDDSGKQKNVMTAPVFESAAFAVHPLPTRPPPVPVPVLRRDAYPRLDTARGPVSHRPSASHPLPSSVEYFPPTPATPYPSRNSYEEVAPHSNPIAYPQATPTYAYPYSTAVPYNHPGYAYGPYYPPQPHPYYVWSPPVGHHGWTGQGLPVSQTVLATHKIPAAAHVTISGPTKKRPSLRYTPDGWCSVDDLASTGAPTSSKVPPSGNGWVKPVPDGIPVPQLEVDVRNLKTDCTTGHKDDDLASSASSSFKQLTPAEEATSHPKPLFIGDVALDSGIFSDSVRFGSLH